jgi:hypothetical protein
MVRPVQPLPLRPKGRHQLVIGLTNISRPLDTTAEDMFRRQNLGR